MTDPLEAAAELIRTELGGVEWKPWVRAKCPKCRRMMLRDPYRLRQPCVFCLPVDGFGNMYGLLLAQEFKLSAKAFAAKLERDGPPWINPKAWIQPRTKWWKAGRPPPTDMGGVHSA